MIVLIPDHYKKRALPVRHVWFAERPRLRDSLLPSIYFHSQSRETIPGFSRRVRYTGLVRVDRDDSELLSSFSKNTRYEIRKESAQADWVISFVEPIGIWEDGPIDCIKSGAKYYADCTVISRAVFDHEGSVEHHYVVDRKLGRSHLLRSQSDYGQCTDADKRNRFGRLNRLLHFRDMLYFRDRGVATYDLGGMANVRRGSKLGNIDGFKRGFSAQLVEESIYVSLSLVLYNRVVHQARTAA